MKLPKELIVDMGALKIGNEREPEIEEEKEM